MLELERQVSFLNIATFYVLIKNSCLFQNFIQLLAYLSVMWTAVTSVLFRAWGIDRKTKAHDSILPWLRANLMYHIMLLCLYRQSSRLHLLYSNDQVESKSVSWNTLILYTIFTVWGSFICYLTNALQSWKMKSHFIHLYTMYTGIPKKSVAADLRIPIHNVSTWNQHF
jgi:K+-transporting ATPase A subunit